MKPLSFVLPSTLFLSSVFLTSDLGAQTVFWEDKSSGQLLFDCDPGNPGGERYAPNNNNWSQSLLISANPCGNAPPVARVVELSNWTSGMAPNSTTVDVVLSGSSPLTVLAINTSASVATLTVASTNELQLDARSTLSVFGGMIQNDGRITLAERINTSAVSTLQIHADTLLSGTGTLVFDSNGYNVINSSDPVHILTVAAGQTLLTSLEAVAGFSGSRIIAAFTNQGTITANVGDLQIDTNPKTNNSLIQSIGGGEVLFKNVTVGNANGTIRAGTGSKVQLDNAIINGGLLDGDGRFDVAVAGGGNATFNGPLAIAPDATVYVDAQHKLFVTGTVTNNGTVRIFNNATNFANFEIVGNATLLGSGQIVLDGNFPSLITSAAPADVLTIGPDQKITTTSVTSFSSALILAAFNNQGTITANEGDLQIGTNPKTNNGTFRASGGGILQILSANTLLTNYNAVTGTLTGGRYEAIGNGSSIIFQNAPIKEIAVGTEVALAGAGASIPALSMLQRINGTLSLRDGATLSVPQSLVVGGRLEFGLGSGNTTALAVNGNLDLTGAVIDVSDLGAMDGIYQVVTATGTITGTPTLGNIPPGLGVSVVVAGGVITVNIITAPEILGIARNPGTDVVTLTYQSISGENFRVEGNTNLSAVWQQLPDTAVGNGGIMTYTNTPPTIGGRYFYRMARDF